MPEIPEMEVYKKHLKDTVINKKIVNIEINREKSINVAPEIFQELVGEQLIVFVSRRAKHLIFTLGNGYYLVAHLMLGGRLYYAQPEEEVKNRGSIVFTFYDQSKLYFINLRLGWLHVYTENEMNEKFTQLGPEPLGQAFSEDKLRELLAERKGAIKPLLTVQEFIAGIGNCYSDEILFAAGIRPERKANELEFAEIKHLYTAIPKTLQEAIKNGGYTEKPYSQNDSLTGGHNDHLKVYDRENEPCFKCNDTIKLTKVSGKKSFFCPTCQT